MVFCLFVYLSTFKEQGPFIIILISSVKSGTKINAQETIVEGEKEGELNLQD